MSEEVYTRNTATSSPENTLAFLIDYFQNAKEQEPIVVMIANRAIEALHTVQACLEEIHKTIKPKLS